MKEKLKVVMVLLGLIMAINAALACTKQLRVPCHTCGGSGPCDPPWLGTWTYTCSGAGDSLDCVNGGTGNGCTSQDGPDCSYSWSLVGCGNSDSNTEGPFPSTYYYPVGTCSG